MARAAQEGGSWLDRQRLLEIGDAIVGVLDAHRARFRG